MLKQQVLQLLEHIHALKADRTNSLPQNTFYLNDTDILCGDRETGDSRYPYYADGLVVWAYSSGQITACESTLHIFKSSNSTEDPNINFFGGLMTENGDWFPIALQNANRQLFEPFDVKRYVIYSAKYMLYVAQTARAVFAVRLHVSRDKHIHFSFTAINTSNEPLTVYMASCIEPRMLTWEEENFWDRMRFCGHKTDSGYLIHADENYLVINEAAHGGKELCGFHSAGRSSFLGKNGRGFTNAEPLKSGKLLHEITDANTTDMPVAADLVHYRLEAGDCVRRDYDLSYYICEEDALSASLVPVDTAMIDNALEQEQQKDIDSLKAMTLRFDDWHGSLEPTVLNRFLVNVQKQVSFCALGKNYAGPLIGIRDVMQQLEVSLWWHPLESREKLVTALHYILEDGRPPRQFSVPTTPDALPMMDLRRFIDQGVWIISTMYTYLSVTDDASILDEVCSYYIAAPDNSHVSGKSEHRDTVLEHLIRIMDYLGSNLDSETGCLRVLHGDWNDALDGLGKTNDPSKDYGSGVSVMASLQFYRNCLEMDEILAHTGRFAHKRVAYATYANILKNGLLRYAIDVSDTGEKRVIHGWGDQHRYKVGSFHDPDGKARRSTTATAFWAITGMLAHTPDLRDTLIADLKAVRSRYGLKTFDVPFARDTYPFVGRLATITAGSYENAAAYVHASLFGIAALFCMGESALAWEELERSMVISHPDCTKTPFVMPNSYCDSDAYCMHGESMGDWYTGSGAVLIKNLIRYGFGIVPTLNGLHLQTAAVMPCTRTSLSLTLKGHPLTVTYENRSQGTRTIAINGEVQPTTLDPLMNTHTLNIPTNTLTDGMHILITD